MSNSFGMVIESLVAILLLLTIGYSVLLNKRLKHGMHPVLTMCAHNAVVKRDPAGNRKLDKSKSRGRIDGMVALAMAASVADTTSHEQHVHSVPLEQILEDA